MLVFVPNLKDPRWGSWCEVDRVPRVNPSAVRAIWRARMKNLHLEGGLPLRQAMEDAASTTASMLGLTERTVRIFVNLERRKRQRAATGRDAGRGGTSGQPRAEQRDVGRPNANVGPTAREAGGEIATCGRCGNSDLTGHRYSGGIAAR
jgi:hypothetical protein